MKGYFSKGMQDAMRGRLGSTAGAELDRVWAQVMESPLWARRRWLWLIGWPGVVGAGVATMCLAFYLSAIQPARAKLDEAQQSAISLEERVRRAADGLSHKELTPPEQLAEFYRIFPNEKNLLPWLEKVFQIARREGVSLDQGEYKVTRDRIGRLARFQMTLPVRSGYPQLRKYLNALRAEIPIVALEHLQFERREVGDQAVEAKIRLALYVEQSP